MRRLYKNEPRRTLVITDDFNARIRGLFVAAKAGDTIAKNDLARFLLPRLVQVSYSALILELKEDAGNVASDAIIKMLDNVHSISADCMSYSVVITKRLCWERNREYRRRCFAVSLGEGLIDLAVTKASGDYESPESSAIRRDWNERFQSAMKLLPKRDQQVLMAKESGESLWWQSIPECVCRTAAYNRLRSAKNRLRSILDQLEFDDDNPLAA